MVIGLLLIDIHIPYATSLKEKRKVLRRLKDRVKNRHNAAISELDFQDTWQRTRVGIVTLNSRKEICAKMLQAVLEEARQSVEGEILKAEFNYF